ncbi:MAG: hypothetical protein ABW194_10650 [Novosphingobium sp.]
MAFLADPDPGLSATPLAPQHFHPPSPRELRSQAVHRLQIGLLGLAGMLLLVGLANIIMDRARVNDDVVAEAAAAASTVTTGAPATAPESPGSDPLADMGVVPDLPAENAPPRPPAAATPVQRPLGR